MRLNTLSPAEGSKHASKRLGRGIGSGWVKPAAVVTKVRSLVLAVAYVAVSKVARCRCTVVCRSLASPLVKRW